MKKTLRFSLLGLALMLAGNIMAQKTVTIDFDADYQTLFPTLPGVSCSANKDQGIEASNDGDFQGPTTSTPVEGVTVTVTPAEDAKTPSRIWDRAPRLRMYSGTFTVTAEDITKIEFTSSTSKFNMSTTNGTLDGKTWVGKSNEVVFDVANNTQINKIVVTLGGETEVIDPNKKGTQDNPYTVAEAQELLSTMEVNVKTDVVFVKGFITKIDEVETVSYGNATYYINDTQTEDNQLEIFRGYYLENKHFTAADQIKVGDEVVVTGQLVNYRSSKAAETDPYTPEMTQGNYIYSLNGKTTAEGDEPGPQPGDDVPALTTCDQVISGEDGTVFHVKGTCTEITNTTFGNWYLQDETGQVYIYGTLDAEGNSKNFSSLGIEVGDVVEVYGPKKTFNETIELVDVKVLSITKGTAPQPQVEEISVEQALDIINEELEDGKTTSSEYIVTGYVVGAPEFQRKDDGSLYGNANFVIADEKGGQPTLTVFRAKSFGSEVFTEETIGLLNENDLVQVQGKLQRFVKDGVMTPELSSCHIVSINGQTGGVTDITASKAADSRIFNLAGQQVERAQKGLYIQGGKKFIAK